ncbi:thiamine phosphate synthase [Brevundimonas sp.]|uniref:thiamine phosphate synthase n=1 Tax=Brevundimonas sp. TaxID=1871086 RepID=UPI0025C1FDDB|nr:thiamine phosphate synthase [Brevundimonas sp.]
MMDLSGDARTLWDAAVALARAAAPVSPRPLPPLLFFTDPVRTPEPWRTAERLPEGAAVVFRGFGREDAPETAWLLREATEARGVRLLIGDDAALAEEVAADGVHLPARRRQEATRLKAARPDWIVTAAVHQAHDGTSLEGLDALIASPIFPTASASARPLIGLEGLSSTVALGLPVYALGGVSPDTVRNLLGSGACGFAGIEAIQRAFG